TSRSLSHARPEPRRATRLIGRHPGRGNLHQDTPAYVRPRSSGSDEASNTAPVWRDADGSQGKSNEGPKHGAKPGATVPAKAFFPPKAKPVGGNGGVKGSGGPGTVAAAPVAAAPVAAAPVAPAPPAPAPVAPGPGGNDGNQPVPPGTDPAPAQGGPAVDGRNPDLTTPSTLPADGDQAPGDG
ncbi:MAG: hypothetical protein ABIR34_10450, partial [Marmoricola sp.]